MPSSKESEVLRTVKADVEFDPRRKQKRVRTGGGDGGKTGTHADTYPYDDDDDASALQMLLAILIVLLMALLYAGITLRVLLVFTGVLHPAWCTLRALNSRDQAAESKWMSYWLLCGVCLCIDAPLSRTLPQWHLVTALELLVLFLLSQNEARNAELIGTHYVRPLFAKHERRILQLLGPTTTLTDGLAAALRFNIGSLKRSRIRT